MNVKSFGYLAPLHHGVVHEICASQTNLTNQLPLISRPGGKAGVRTGIICPEKTSTTTLRRILWEHMSSWMTSAALKIAMSSKRWKLTSVTVLRLYHH